MKPFDMDEALTVEHPRVAELRAALHSASDELEMKDNAYLIKGWLDEEAVSLVYGTSNTGKSFFAIDLAFHVAAGIPWQGHRVKQGAVLYLAAEGGKGFKRRLGALKVGRAELFEQGKDAFRYLQVQIDLRSEDSNAICAAVGDHAYSLVIVDTLAMTFGDGNENDARDMTEFMRQVNALRERMGCHVMLIHHPGKDTARGARGSSTLRASIDTEILIESEAPSGIRTATCSKQRDGEVGLSVAFTLEIVQLGTDRDGDPVTSCVVAPTDAKPAKKRMVLRGNNEIAMQAMWDALRLHGCRITSTANLPSSCDVVAIEDWRTAFFAKRAGKELSDDTNRRAFTRACDWLQNNDRVRIQDDWAWAIVND
jgi:hypothetical protein